MSETKIEWTDATLDRVVKREAVDQGFMHEREVDRVEPFIEVAIALPTVARAACRDDIRSEAVAGLRYGLQVIPSRCRRRTVGAAPVERLGQLNLSLGVDRFARSLPRVRVLPSSRAMHRVVCIATTLILSVMLAAPSLTNFGGRTPFRTVAAPLQSARLCVAALKESGAWCLSRATALATQVGDSIGSTAVLGEPRQRQPAPASRAWSLVPEPKLNAHAWRLLNG